MPASHNSCSENNERRGTAALTSGGWMLGGLVSSDIRAGHRKTMRVVLSPRNQTNILHKSQQLASKTLVQIQNIAADKKH